MSILQQHPVTDLSSLVNILSIQSGLANNKQALSSQVGGVQNRHTVQYLPTPDNLSMGTVPTLCDPIVSVSAIDQDHVDMDQVSTGSQVKGTQDTQSVQSLPTLGNVDKKLLQRNEHSLTEMDQAPIGSQAGGVQGSQVACPLSAPDYLIGGYTLNIFIFLVFMCTISFMAQNTNTSLPYVFMNETNCPKNYWSHIDRTTFYVLDWKRNEFYFDFAMNENNGKRICSFFLFS